MSAQFNPGDVVRLKSGSPDMTVEKTGDESDIFVVYFDNKNHEVVRISFPADTLVKER